MQHQLVFFGVDWYSLSPSASVGTFSSPTIFYFRLFETLKLHRHATHASVPDANDTGHKCRTKVQYFQGKRFHIICITTGCSTAAVVLPCALQFACPGIRYFGDKNPYYFTVFIRIYNVLQIQQKKLIEL